MSAEWRLLESPALEAAENMALDRAIQLAHARGDTPPTLRLYEWCRPTVTLGKFQDAEDLNAHACTRFGIDVVRRFTGGRGVLHDDELTYAVVAGERDGVPRGVAASYRHFSAALARAYEAMGVPARLTSRDRGVRDSSACYLHATQADLSVGTAKLSGSAQVWFERTCLQHGSFIMSRDIDREAEVFMLDDRECAALRTDTVTLEDVVKSKVLSENAVREVVKDAFEVTLGVSLISGECTATESIIMRDLLEEVKVDLGV